MAKSKAQKKEMVRQLSLQFDEAASVVFSTFSEISMADLEQLRNDFRENDALYTVTKKTLLSRVLVEKGIEGLDVARLEKNVGVAFGMGDEVAAAKILRDFQKTHELMEISGGLLEKKFISPDQVESLAKLPSKNQIRANVVCAMNAPISGFVRALGGVMGQFVNVLQAIKCIK